MFFPAQFDQTELGRRSYCATKRTAHSMVRTSSKGTQTKGTDMTGNTTARTQAIELAERLREVAAWNVRLHLAKEGLEQQTLCEAAGVTKATISARMNLDAAWDLNAIAAAAVTLGMPPAELLDDTLYDIVNNDDTNTGADKGASLVAALTSTLLARHIAGRCNPLKTKGSCRITMIATGANRYPQRGYEKPGVICCVEYDPETKHVVGYPKRIWRGATDRGCIEAPHLTKRDGWYYIMCAEGGTGYNHSVTMGRSRNVWGPYEPDPNGPLVTSQPKESNERADDDHLKPRYFNPDSVLQKSGHGSYVDLPNGETYLVHLTSRPFVPELRCTLGRETAIQKMQWTPDGWLRMADGSNLAKIEVEEPNLPDVSMPEIPGLDDFDSGELGNWYYSPRQMPSTFANVTERPGWLRIRGEESLASLNRTSLLTRKLTSVYATVTTKMEFEPEVYQHSAGLTIYYDNMNNIFLRKYYSQTLGGSAISIVRLENGDKTEMLDTRVAVEDKPIYFRLNIEGRRTWFEWGYDGEEWTKIGPDFDITTFSDEYCKFGEFTGTMVGIVVTDASLHEKTADFDFFDYEADETKPVD